MASDAPHPRHGGPRLLACVGDAETAQVIEEFAAAQRWRDVRVLDGGIAAAHGQLQHEEEPLGLLIVDIDEAEDPLEAVAALRELCTPQTGVIALGRRDDLNLYRALLELGVTEYLTKPITAAMLNRTLSRGRRAQAGEEGRHAQIITFMGARGGVGTTTVAAGLAWSLAHLHGRQAALLDLDLHFGNLALNLDLVPGPGLREALEFPARIDARLLASAILHESPQLTVLAAEEPLLDHPQTESEAIGAIAAVLRSECDFILIDLPRHPSEIVRRTLALANTACIVTDLSLASARDALRIGDFNRALAPGAQHMVIGNQVGAVHRGEVGRAEFERVVGLTLDYAIPFEPQAALATSSTGKALPEALRSSKASAELMAMAQRIGGIETPTKRSLMKKLLPGLPSLLKRSA
jgi:pilus assembly protein CpaE